MGWSRVESTIVLVCFVAVFVEGQGALEENKIGALSEFKEVSPPSITLHCGRRKLTPIGFLGKPILLGSRFITSGIRATSKRRRKRSSSFSSVRDRVLKNSKLKLLRRRKRRIAGSGGIPSFANSWPWMVLLGRRRGPSNIFFCGGALINTFYVLTAAHCVLDPEPFFVRLGEHEITNANSMSKREDIEIANVTFHPSYALGLGYHDIALVQLAKPVTFRREVQPVCLPWGKTGTEDLFGQTVTLTGWGAETFGGPLSPILREVKVKVFEPFKCQQSYATLPDFIMSFPKGMSKDNIVCAGETEGVKDSCQGDSGGPMVHEGQNGRYTLAGVISKGYGCGKVGFPGLYAPLRHYDTLQWIKNVAF